MLPDVRPQYTGGSEGLGAVHTLVRPLPAVHPHVFVETRGLAEALPTNVTVMGSVPLVYVQDVDTQPVSLLK